jgi:threonine dehydratase
LVYSTVVYYLVFYAYVFSGNHGQALAWAAQQKGIPAHIVMPSDAPLCKQRGVAGYNGLITFCEPNQAAR